MSFWKRVRVYILGLGIGSLMVLFLFGDRGCGGWLPANRVKTSIMESIFETSDFIDCKLKCNNFTQKKIENLILEGDVLFKESKTDEDPREYIIEHKSEKLVFAVPVDTEAPVYILDNFENTCVECDSVSKKFDRTIKLNFKKRK
jgi:hypothetical protein